MNADPRQRMGALIAALAAFAVLLGVAVAHAAFSAPVNLSAPGAYPPEIATDADGDAVAVWRRSDGSNQRVQARTISATGALGPIRTLSAAGQNGESYQIATDADGDAVAVWLLFDGSDRRLQARTISATGALGPIQNLTATDQTVLGPRIAMNADGDGIVAWVRTFEGIPRVQTRTISATGALGPTRNLSAAGQYGADPQIASDADGDAVAVWETAVGLNHRIKARTISAAGALGSISNLSADGQYAAFPQIAGDAEGDAVAAWERDLPSSRIQARTISAAGVLGPKQTLSAPGQLLDGPQVAIDADGGAVVAWLGGVNGFDHLRAQYSRGP